MKVALFFRAGINKKEITNKIKTILDIEICNENPDYVITFGGDGTFLTAVNKYGFDVKYIPINMGTLGFYTSWEINKLEKLKADLKNYQLSKAPVLDIVVSYPEKDVQFSCLNEITIINPVKTQILDIYINDFQIETSRGTGICVATPTGSTAYNKSLGGAIIAPNKKLFQLTQIAAINNIKYRTLENSIICDQNEQVTLYASKNDFYDSVLTIDRKTYQLKNATKVVITLSNQVTQILVPHDNNFYKRVKQAFIG